MNCAAALERTRPFRVLIVDDDEAIRSALPAVLAGPWVEVITAPSLDAAKQILESHLDLVITDLRLRTRDDTDGFELVSWVHERTPEVPIIVLTAYGSAETRAEAIRLGAADLWVKSVGMPVLIDRLRQLGFPAAGKEPKETE